MQKNRDDSEKLDLGSFERIAGQVIGLKQEGYNVILVSSGAITAGMVETGLAARPDKDSAMPELQRLASIGWRHVLNAWSDALGSHVIGEILLTRHELKLASEREEALRVTHTLLSHGNIAIVNENDAISHEEIAFGDNDTLAAMLSARIAGSGLFGKKIKLVILSDIDGVYEDKNDPSTLIKNINDVEKYRHAAGEAGPQGGTGGMVTKFKAAEIATEAGVEMSIANGRRENVILETLSGQTGTHFTV